MLNSLVEAAVSLEERMRASALHKLHAFYTVGWGGIDPTAVNFLFGRRDHMLKARELELAYAVGLISEAMFDAGFPKVFYLAVNGHYYCIAERPSDSSLVSEGIALVKQGYESMLREITVELCFGSGLVYTPNDDKVKGDLVLSFRVSQNGTVSKVWRGLSYEKAPAVVMRGESALEAFGRLESFVMAP